MKSFNLATILILTLLHYTVLAQDASPSGSPSGSPSRSPSDSPSDSPTAETTTAPVDPPANNDGLELPAWKGCVNPNNPEPLVQSGKETSICMNLSNGDNWASGVKYSRWLFTPKADEYSHFKVKNSYKDLVVNDNDFLPSVSVHVSSQTSLSFIRRYYDQAADRIFPYLTAIIDVKDGKVQGIAWDNACVFCLSDVCEENSYNFAGELTDSAGSVESKGCHLTKAQCDAITADGDTSCDLQIYVVWTGTDANGRVLLSSNSRYGAFPSNKIQQKVSKQFKKIPKISLPGFGA
mmetsp:Transcript_45224/g.52964  ORF Transcript_45224/g.52964 Transcript_45224/m.52964 type:complete len:293 (-) Transcript_45224:240-1118(-)